ncbi:hypothetical protein [Paenibacillus agricola]|uniref:hypothetical protein n=1 Tax=Paenibacillus agricola TaxID=2716264 RepID=UPI001A9F54C1|nr:hypothetical protein [Paenibacillus agricola]
MKQDHSKQVKIPVDTAFILLLSTNSLNSLGIGILHYFGGRRMLSKMTKRGWASVDAAKINRWRPGSQFIGD